MASRNQSQWQTGPRSGDKAHALIRRETGYATGFLETDGSWNLSPLRKNGHLPLKENFCGLILLDIKRKQPGANLTLAERFPELTRQENGKPSTQLMGKEHGGGI